MNIKGILNYEPKTGCMTWLESRGRIKAGDIAGNTHVNGYRRLSIDGKEQLCHRLAWEAVHGEIPAGLVIDHINGDRGDNRIQNLRAVPQSINAQNRSKASSHNKTGLLGVSFHKRSKRFNAQINVQGASLHLGSFISPELAHEAYCKAKKALHIGNEAYLQQKAA